MPALFLNLLKFIFLGMIYLFLWQVAKAIGSHVGPEQSPSRRRKGGELVVIHSDTGKGQRFSVTRPMVVGRGDDADIIIDDPYASDAHFRLSVQDGGVMLHDMGSTNGTYVNGRRVTTPMNLSKGDAVQVGKTILEVR